MARRTQHEDGLPVLVVFIQWRLDEILDKLDKRRLLLLKERVSGELLLVLGAVAGHDVVSVHGVVVAAPVLHVPGVILEFINVRGHKPLKRVSNHQELDGLGNKLLEEVFGQQGILLPEEGVEAEAIVLGNLGLRNVSEVQESVEPGGGGGLKI